MAVNFDNVPAYVEQEKLGLIKRTVLGGKTLSYFNVQAGVKGTATVNVLDVNPELQAGGCGFEDAGTAKVSQRAIATKLLKVNKSICDKDFLNYFTSYAVKVGAGKEVLPFEEMFTNGIVEKVNESIEKMVWQGNDSANQFKGILPILEGEEDVISVSGTGAYETVKKAYMAIPENILDKAVIFVGQDTFRSLTMDLLEKNYFHYSADSNLSEIVLPATNTKVIAVAGLNGSKAIVAGNPANFYYGCDMMDDAEAFDLWYSKDNREWRIAISFNGGVQVAFVDEVVVGKMA